MKDLDIAMASRVKDEKIADDQRKENILVEYQNSLAKLLIDYGMTLNESASARFVVRVKTLTAVKQLDPVRKAFLIQSLFEANLITTTLTPEPIISLESADLSRLNIGNDENNIERPSHPCLSLSRAILNNASFRREEFNGASFKHAHIRYGDFTDSMTVPSPVCYNQLPSKYINFESAMLTEANFVRALFVGATFSFAEMFRTNLQGFDCHECEMMGTNLTQSDLIGATFIGPADLTGLKLVDSKLINARFRDNINLKQADMTRVNAAGITIVNCYLGGSVLMNSSFSMANIKDSDFRYAQIISANMVQVMVNNTIFNSATLIGVNFTDAKCYKCMFINASFTGSKFHGASFIASNFTNAMINNEQLAQFASLTGSILPNGTTVIS